MSRLCFVLPVPCAETSTWLTSEAQESPSLSLSWPITIPSASFTANNRWKTHSTKLDYRGYLHKWIIPRWGGHTLTRIRAGEIELWRRSKPLASSTCAKIRNVMSVLFNHGMRNELLDRNPVKWVRKSAKRRKISAVLEIEQLNRYWVPSKSVSEPWSCSMSLLVTTVDGPSDRRQGCPEF